MYKNVQFEIEKVFTDFLFVVSQLSIIQKLRFQIKQETPTPHLPCCCLRKIKYLISFNQYLRFYLLKTPAFLS